MLTYATTHPVNTGRPHMHCELQKDDKYKRKIVQSRSNPYFCTLKNETMKKSIVILLIILSNISIGQILDVNNKHVTDDSARFFIGTINFSFKINNQSSTKDEEVIFKGLDTKVDMAYIGQKNAYILINKLNYFSSTGGPFVSTGYSHFRVNWLRQNFLSYETFAQAQYDDGRKMPLRTLLGAGIQMHLLQRERSIIQVGIGGMFETEKWKNPEIEDDVIRKEIWKTTNYLRANVALTKSVSFRTITYYQGGYDSDDELWRSRLTNDSNLTILITDRLSFITNFSIQYDFNPIIPILEYNYSLTNGLLIRL